MPRWSSIDQRHGFNMDVALEEWITPTLLNGWTQFGSGFALVGYMKDPWGWVHLNGVITGGTATAGTDLFVLPVGYRPSHIQAHAMIASDVVERLDIKSDGVVELGLAVTNTYLSLCGISFRIAP